MLILVGPTNWDNPINLILSTSSSGSSFSHNNVAPQRQRGSFLNGSPTPPNRRNVVPHQKGIDNPFSVIYDPNSARATENRKSGELQSLSYLHIEKELQAGRSPAKSAFLNPIVTVIDETSLRRAGSVLSRSLSTMNHGTIRRRNRMAKRLDVKSTSASVYSGESEKSKAKSKQSRWKSLFPIKRKTSFRYTPVSKAHHRPHFESQKDADNFFLLDGIASVVRDMLPRTMLTYKYKKITHILPQLHLHPERFTITRNNSFYIVDSKSASGPLQATKMTRPIDKETIHRFPETRKVSVVSARRQVFLSTVYKEYREKVFANKYQIPPKFELLLPFEAGIMKPEEKSSIDVKILLEVLLRRTAAAKIEFRLAQSGYMDSSSKSSIYTSDHSLSPKSSGKDKASRDSSTNKNSYSTTNSSLFDDRESTASHNPLPSPQISSVSEFEELYNFLRESLRESPRELETMREAESLREAETLREKDSSYMSSMNQDTAASRFTHTPKTQITCSPRTNHSASPPSPRYMFSSSSLYSGTSSKVPRQANKRNTSIDNFLFAPPSSDVGSLSNMNMYSLQPMNRSVTTISSALDFNSDSGQQSNESRILPLRIPPTKKARGDSNSTTDTSVIHSLDDLSKRMSQYLAEELETPKSMHLGQTNHSS